MNVHKPEQWRILTPILGVLNFIGMGVVGILTWFMVRTVDQFDRHLEKIDNKFEKQEAINNGFEHRITLVQGQCCKRSLSQEEYSLLSKKGDS